MTKSRKHLFAPLALIICTGVSAQVKFGVKTGWSFSNIQTSNNQGAVVSGSSQSFKNVSKTGFTGGIFLAIPVYKGLQFQPELEYSNQGAEAHPVRNYSITADETYHLNYLGLPLLLKYKLPLGFFAETGPRFSWLLKARIHETVVGAAHTQYYDVKSAYKSTDFGWAIGGGYLSPINLGIDLRYNIGMSNINNASAAQLTAAPIQNAGTKNSAFQLAVFYVFGKTSLQSSGRRAQDE